MRLANNEYLDTRAASPGPFKTAELAGLVKVARQDNAAVVFIEPGASEVLSLVSEWRQKLVMLNAAPLAIVGGALKLLPSVPDGTALAGPQ